MRIPAADTLIAALRSQSLLMNGTGLFNKTAHVSSTVTTSSSVPRVSSAAEDATPTAAVTTAPVITSRSSPLLTNVTANATLTNTTKPLGGCFEAPDADDDFDGNWGSRWESSAYYQYTPETASASRFAECYAQWTIQNSMDPRFKELGEAKFFSREYAEPDFECAFDLEGTCRDLPPITALEHIYGPENRSLIRRIYFVQRVMNSIHTSARTDYRISGEIENEIEAYVPWVVDSFTWHASPTAERLCRVRTIIVDMFIQIAISIAVSGAGHFASVPLDKVVGGIQQVVELAAQDIATRTTKGMTEVMADKFVTELGGMASIITKYVGKGSGWAKDAVVSQLENELNRQAAGPIADKSTTPDDNDPSAWVTSSPSKHPLCSDLNVGGQNMDLENKEALAVGVAEFLGGIRRAQRGGYTKIYNGYFPEDGGPSLLSMIMSSLVAMGVQDLDRSIRAQEWDRRAKDMKQHLMEGITGKVAADDHQYLKCTVVPDAEQLMKNKDNGPRTHWANSVFRPRPLEHPNMVCEAGRFYVELQGKSREVEASFVSDGEDPDAKLTKFRKFGFTVNSLLQKAYDLYEQNGNQGSQKTTDIGTIDFTTGGFDLPVCFHEAQYLKDYSTAKRGSWKLPMLCGDHTGNETATFLRKVRLFPKANDPSQISSDRVERAIQDAPPFTSFMNLCNLNMTPPQVNGNRRFFTHNQSHPECENVRNITKGWGKHRANEWFCNGKLGKKICEGDLRYYGVRGEWDGLGDKCHTWRTSNYYETTTTSGPIASMEDLEPWNWDLRDCKESPWKKWCPHH